MFTIEIDDRQIVRLFDTLAKSFDSFQPETKDILKGMQRSTRLDFSAGGRPDKWKPDKESTLKSRRAWARRNGKTLPAGDAPLRQSDSLFKSLTDSLAPDAIAEATKDEAIYGTDLPYAGRQDEARHFLLIQDEDAEAYAQRLVFGLRQRCNAAARAAQAVNLL